MLTSSVAALGLGLLIGAPFLIATFLYARRLVRTYAAQLRARGVDLDRLRLRGVAGMQAAEQSGFHPGQWLRKKAILLGWRYLR